MDPVFHCPVCFRTISTTVKEAHMKSHDVVVRNISGTQQSNMSVPSQTNARKSLLTINRSGINQTKRAEDVSPVAPVANSAPEMETSVCTTDVSTKTNILPTSISGGSKPVPMTKRTEDASPVPPVATSVPKIETPVCSTAVSTKTNIFMTSVSGGSKSAPMRKTVQYSLITEVVQSCNSGDKLICAICKPSLSNSELSVHEYIDHVTMLDHMTTVFSWLINTPDDVDDKYKKLVKKLKDKGKTTGMFCELCQKASFNLKDLSAYKTHLASTVHCSKVKAIKAHMETGVDQAPKPFQSQSGAGRETLPQSTKAESISTKQSDITQSSAQSHSRKQLVQSGASSSVPAVSVVQSDEAQPRNRQVVATGQGQRSPSWSPDRAPASPLPPGNTQPGNAHIHAGSGPANATDEKYRRQEEVTLTNNNTTSHQPKPVNRSPTSNPPTGHHSRSLSQQSRSSNQRSRHESNHSSLPRRTHSKSPCSPPTKSSTSTSTSPVRRSLGRNHDRASHQYSLFGKLPPRRHSKSPRKPPRSSMKHSRSPNRDHRLSKRWPRSPGRRSRSPRKHSRSPRKRSRSPRKRSRSPRKPTRSPRKRSRSPRNLSQSLRRSPLHRGHDKPYSRSPQRNSQLLGSEARTSSNRSSSRRLSHQISTTSSSQPSRQQPSHHGQSDSKGERSLRSRSRDRHRSWRTDAHSRLGSVSHRERRSGAHMDDYTDDGKPISEERVKLRLRNLSPWSADSLTFLVDQKWTEYHEAYYDEDRLGDERCLKAQHEYIKAYDGFFLDEPKFDLKYTSLVKPELLREVLVACMNTGTMSPIQSHSAMRTQSIELERKSNEYRDNDSRTENPAGKPGIVTHIDEPLLSPAPKDAIPFDKLKAMIREKLHMSTSPADTSDVPAEITTTSDATLAFDDPLLGFVHNILSGILTITELQDDLDSGRLDSEGMNLLYSQQRLMHENMVKPDGHLLIKLSRCCLSTPETIETIERTFPEVSEEVVAVLQNLDQDVLELIANTPILNT